MGKRLGGSTLLKHEGDMEIAVGKGRRGLVVPLVQPLAVPAGQSLVSWPRQLSRWLRWRGHDLQGSR